MKTRTCITWGLALSCAFLLGLGFDQDSEDQNPKAPEPELKEVNQPTGPVAPPKQESEAEGEAEAQPEIPMPERSPVAVKKAMDVLEKAAEAYQKAPQLRDDISVWSPHPLYGPNWEQKVLIEFYGGTDALVKLDDPGYTFFSVGREVYAQQKRAPTKYCLLDLKTDLSQTVKADGTNGVIFPHFMFRRSRDAADLAEAITRTLKDGQVEGYHRAEIDGQDVHEVYALGSNGDAYIAIDPETMFINKYTVQLDPQGDFEGAIITFQFRPEVREDLERPDHTRFESDDYTQVATMEELVPVTPIVGDKAPRFHMPKPDGSGTIKFCENLDKFNYILFWAETGDMSGGALATVEEMYHMAKDQDLPINFLCVNTLEAMEDREDELKQKVLDFWSEHNFSTDVVYDLEAIAADNYNIQYIPTAVIVDRNGIIRKTWNRQDAEQTQEIFDYITHLIEVEGTDEDVIDKPDVVPHDHDGDGRPDH